MSHTTIAERVLNHRDSTGIAMVMPWEIDSVVSIKGSFNTAPNTSKRDQLAQGMLIGMLDKGTTRRSKLKISSELEDCGASIRFSDTGTGVQFDAKCLKSDIGMVLSLVNEQLRLPALDSVEFELLRKRHLANIQRQESDTGSQASYALSRAIFSPLHPSYVQTTHELIADIQAITPEEVRAFHAAQFGANDLVVTVVGDVKNESPKAILEAIRHDFSPIRLSESNYLLAPSGAAPEQTHLEIKDRNNVDVRLGHGINLLKSSPDYIPLFLGVFMLGGNFSSHLMNTIRDRDGLTYGIRSSLSDIHVDYPGAWITSVTLSSDKLQQGIQKTIEEIAAFLAEERSESALDMCKTTLTGSYQIQLSTTSGLASRLLVNEVEKRPLERIDTYPNEIQEVSMTDVSRVIATYLKTADVHVFSAGSAGSRK